MKNDVNREKGFYIQLVSFLYFSYLQRLKYYSRFIIPNKWRVSNFCLKLGLETKN